MSTSIQWAANPDGSPGETWNPIVAVTAAGRRGWHCEKVSAGCAGCYAERRNRSGRCNMGTKLPYTRQSRDKVRIELHEPTLMKPLHWRKPRTIFVCSMSDVFGKWVSDEIINLIFAVMALTPQHRYMILTKRPRRMTEYLSQRDDYLRTDWADAADKIAIQYDDGAAFVVPLPNVVLGTSIEDQATADERIPHLLCCPAAVRGLSIEPLLSRIVLPACGECLGCGWQSGREGDHDDYVTDTHYTCSTCGGRPLNGIDWLIIGICSNGARVGSLGDFASEADWIGGAIDLVRQCDAASVPVFVKQIPVNGRVCHDVDQFPKPLQRREMPQGATR